MFQGLRTCCNCMRKLKRYCWGIVAGRGALGLWWLPARSPWVWASKPAFLSWGFGCSLNCSQFITVLVSSCMFCYAFVDGSIGDSVHILPSCATAVGHGDKVLQVRKMRHSTMAGREPCVALCTSSRPCTVCSYVPLRVRKAGGIVCPAP